MLNGVLEKDIEKLQKRASFALGLRKGLMKFGRGPDEEVKSFTDAAKEGEAAGKTVNKGIIGAVAGIATEAVRRGATALVEKVDSTIENKFETAVAEYNQNLIMILLRDIAMSAGPLLILTLIPTIVT